MCESVQLEEMVRRARLRIFFNLAVSQVAVGTCAALAGLLALLIVGADIFDWRWVVAVSVGTFAVGCYRTCRHLPTAYTTAVLVDQGLGLHDTLSTAFHFSLSQDQRASGRFIEAQRRRAQEVCRTVDIQQALPLKTPKAMSTGAFLAAAALAVIALRYGITRSLDLHPPIVSVTAFDTFKRFPHPENDTARHNRESNAADPHSEEIGIALPHEATNSGDPLPPDYSLHPAEANIASTPADKTSSRSPVAQNHTEGRGPSALPEELGDTGSPPGFPEDKSPSPGLLKKPVSDSSLMDKLRDAMADLLAKLKIQPKPGTPQSSEVDPRGGLRAGDRQRTAGENGQTGTEQRPEERGGAGDTQADPEGQSTAQGANGKPDPSGSGRKISGQERSGAGKEEGAKDVKEAEQLATMGKISEILGKRSASLTGEVTVEVSSSKAQDLKTPYSQIKATHREASGEIYRDEVPLIFQDYVEQYFLEVRKMPARERH